jgi:DNA-binding NarL/FixJ family response regulator
VAPNQELARAHSHGARIEYGRHMSSGHGLKVLVIDDSAIVRRVLRRHLKSDARVQYLFAASNAADGYSLFKISRPNAVVLNLDLPDLHGLEILKMIKGTAPGCVVIVLTACEESEMRELCLRHGADFFLKKESNPLTLLTIANAIPELCRPGMRSGSPKGVNNHKREAR